MLISLKKALDLLNYPNATTSTPTFTENDNRKTFLVTRKSSKKTYNDNVLEMLQLHAVVEDLKLQKHADKIAAVKRYWSGSAIKYKGFG